MATKQANETLAPTRTFSARLARGLREPSRSFIITFIVVVLLAFFLSPLLRITLNSFKTPSQVAELGTPLYPAKARVVEYQGKEYEIYKVPFAEGVRELALYKKGRATSEFIDPANLDAPPIVWTGAWRSLDRAWEFAPTLTNYQQVWDLLNYPRLMFNTIALAVIGTFGTLISNILVAYGFARFRIPGKQLLFTIVIATVFLPEAVTLIPTYTFYVKIGWIGTWLPLLVPAFFANAFDIFLLRQFFLTIPREMDEAAKVDGAGPFRILRSVILPQAWPAVIAVGIFHFVYAWNDYFAPLIYLSTRPDLQPISVGLARFNSIYGNKPELTQAGTILTLIIPVIIFIFMQKFFMQGVVITGVDK
ncbi:carbohydrate ABC transporter permease [Anaerolineae bacterium CFX7]|nr:carbohydrate ABC transporter permease [Anaerolineae bacterium CFX7]